MKDHVEIDRLTKYMYDDFRVNKDHASYGPWNMAPNMAPNPYKHL